MEAMPLVNNIASTKVSAAVRDSPSSGVPSSLKIEPNVNKNPAKVEPSSVAVFDSAGVQVTPSYQTVIRNFSPLC